MTRPLAQTLEKSEEQQHQELGDSPQHEPEQQADKEIQVTTISVQPTPFLLEKKSNEVPPGQQKKRDTVTCDQCNLQMRKKKFKNS